MRRGRVRLEHKSTDETPKSAKILKNRDPRHFRMVAIQPHDHNTRLDYHERSKIPEKTQLWDLMAWVVTFVVIWLIIFYLLTAEKAADQIFNG